MSKFLSLILITVAITSCSTNKSSEDQQSAEASKKIVLKKLWETDSLLTVAESAIYDASTDQIYVSCIGDKQPLGDKNGDGFIARVSPQGEILERQWITGLNAPKGLGIFQGRLFIADLDALVTVDIASGTVETKTIIPNAVYLNDVTSDKDGNVYIVDSNGQGIFMLQDGQFSSLIRGDSLGRPNGVFVDGDQVFSLLFNAGHFVVLDKESKRFTSIASGMPKADGIVKFNDHFILSSWSGQIYSTRLTGGKVETLLDTSSDKINAADIGSIEKDSILLVPTFFDNRLMAYKISVE